MLRKRMKKTALLALTAIVSTAAIMIAVFIPVSLVGYATGGDVTPASGGNITPAKTPAPAVSSYMVPMEGTGISIQNADGTTQKTDVYVRLTIQGEKAMAAFRASLPAGAKEGNTYNLGTSKGTTYDKKTGTIRLNLGNPTDTEYVMLFLDKKGVVHTYADTDSNPKTFTTKIDVEGYAFMMAEVPAGTVVTGNTYTVVPGDTLSKIAGRFNTTIPALIQVNNIKNPNVIYAGQVLVIK